MTDCSDGRHALVFDIYRGTTHDGPGMRTTFFLKGCPLACKWCHNPESISVKNQISYTKRKCIGCGICSQVGGKEIIRNTDGKIERIAPLDEIPPVCAENCPTKALAMEARVYSVDELFAEALKDAAYFESFGGGVTISGGEPTIHAPFVLALLKKLKAQGIHTALDTSGFVQWETLALLLPYVDVVLYDIKTLASERHLALTGVRNELIVENFHKLAAYKRSRRSDIGIWVRTPLIPKDTATVMNIFEIGKFLKAYASAEVDRWELCAFNNTCTGKYEQLGIAWAYKDTPLLTDRNADALLDVAKYRFSEKRTVLSGLTRKDV